LTCANAQQNIGRDIESVSMRRKNTMLRPGDRSHTVILLAVGAGLVAMAALSGVLGVADFVRVSGPGVGDVVAFDASFGVPADLPTRVSVVRADGMQCQLDLEVMQRVHGSLIVDAATSESPHVYRLHWAGTHSSLGTGDCGANADITASDTVMATLLVATGGVGVGPGKQALPVYLLRHAPKGGE
jgi:hypothetical protein